MLAHESAEERYIRENVSAALKDYKMRSLKNAAHGIYIITAAMTDCDDRSLKSGPFVSSKSTELTPMGPVRIF